MALSSRWRRALAACVEMGHLARKPHLCDTVSMRIHREMVNICGMRAVSTGKRNWNSKIKIHLLIPVCSGRSRGSLSCSGWSLHCLSLHVTRQRGHLWIHRASGFILSNLFKAWMLPVWLIEPRLLERAIQGLKWCNSQPEWDANGLFGLKSAIGTGQIILLYLRYSALSVALLLLTKKKLKLYWLEWLFY